MPAPDTLPLWREVRVFLLQVFTLFGAPEAVAAKRMLTAREAQPLMRWLRGLEIMLRRLVLIEAAALPAPACALPRPRTFRPRAQRVFTQDPETPANWRVSFRLIERSAPNGCRRYARGEIGALRNSWPLAERLEAALRVFNDPAPYAARLARRLTRAPRLAGLMLLHTVPPNTPGGETLEGLGPPARAAAAHFIPSG